MLKGYEKGLVTTLCGVVGPPPGMIPKPGTIKASGWPTWVTCPECLEHPGVRPRPIEHPPHNHGPDCECLTFFPPVDLDAKTKGYNG